MPYCVGWCGTCYEAKKGRTRGHARATPFTPAQPAPQERRARVKKPAKSNPVPDKPVQDSTSGFRERYPNVAAHLLDLTYEDGSGRRTSTLLFFMEDGAIKVCLHDREENRSAFLSGGDLGDCLAQLEDALEQGSLMWRQRRLASGGGR